MSVIRFAPALDGPIDVDEARRAVVSARLAESVGGRLAILVDDLEDEPRALEDLAWLGLAAEEARLSAHLPAAEAALGRLRAASRAYECFETPLELEMAERRARAEGRAPLYDRAALVLTNAERDALRETRNPHLRFLLAPGEIGWEDLVAGPVSEDAGRISDPVLTRADGQPLRPLWVVAADIALGTTHALEPAEARAETAARRQIFAALGTEPPATGHLPAPEAPAGGALPALAELRAGGADPGRLRALLAGEGAFEPARLAAPPPLDLRALAAHLS